MSRAAHGDITIGTASAAHWRAKAAVIVYEAEHGESEETHAYATVHGIEGEGKHTRLGAGTPATKEACAGLARSLGAASTLAGFVPPHLVYLGARSLIWWRPAGTATMHFDTTATAAGDQADDKTGARLIGKRAAVTPQPGLVFAVTARDWYVYALSRHERVTPEAKLLRAPYFNVWADGRICTGNVRLPDALSTTSLEAYERAFFGSRFTHPNMHGAERLVRHEKGAYALWRELLDGKHTEFPEGTLIDAKLTLAALAKRLDKGTGRER